MFCVAQALTLFCIIDIQEILSKLPTNKDVLMLLVPIKERWYIIGTALEVSPEE